MEIETVNTPNKELDLKTETLKSLFKDVIVETDNMDEIMWEFRMQLKDTVSEALFNIRDLDSKVSQCSSRLHSKIMTLMKFLDESAKEKVKGGK